MSACVSNYSVRLRADHRALLRVLAAVVLCGVAFRLTHAQLFGALIAAALGLYVIRFSRLAYRDPDETIGAWQSFYGYLRPGSVRSRRFLRGVAVAGLFAGTLLVAASVAALVDSPFAHPGFRWLWIGGSALTTLLLPLPTRHPNKSIRRP